MPYLLLSMGVAALLLTRISLVVPKPAVALSPEYFITEIPIHGESSVPWLRGITKGLDGNLWFTESNGNNIGRITPDGKITEFLAPTAQSEPYGDAVGPGSTLWFTESQKGAVGA